MKLLKCIGVQNILTVQCAEINAARQRGNVRSPHDTSCAIISYTTQFATKVLIRPVSLHGVLGRFVYLRRSLN